MFEQTLKTVTLRGVVAFGLMAAVGPCFGQPPTNRFLADSPWPMTHCHPFNQGSSPLAGPVKAAEAVPHLIPGEPVPITLAISGEYPDGRRAIWGTTLSYVFKLDANGDNFRYVSQLRREQSRPDAVSGAYSLIDCDGDYYVPRGRFIEVYHDAVAGQLDSVIEKKRAFELPAELVDEDELIVGMNMTFDGRLVFVTDSGLVGALSRDFADFEHVRLAVPNEETGHVTNSIAVDDEGRIIVVTHEEVVCVRWDPLAQERLAVDWRVDYPTDGIRMMGRLGRGSGTTPSLMGSGSEDKLVAIGDGRKMMNVVLIWRGDIPDEWVGLPGHDRRIAAEVPATFGMEKAERSTTEQSLTVWGHELVVVSNLYGELTPMMKRFVRRRMGNDVHNMTIYRSNTASVAPYGIQKLSWDQDTNRLTSAWVRPDLSCPNGIPTMSSATGLLYFIGQREGDWTLEAVHWDNGESAFYQRLDNHRDNNSFYAATEIGCDGSILTGTLGGVLRFSKTPPKTETVSRLKTNHSPQ